MKKYFVKYLPVEGEIKEHATVFKDFEIGTVVHLYPNKDAYEIEFFEKGMSKETATYPASRVKLAKLFLCSRDKSDRRIDMDTQQWQELSRDEREEYLYKYTPIGEISPDAVWVTEGMEFEESEVEVTITCPKCGSEYNDGFCPEDIDCEIDKKRPIAKIKCSQCKQFH